MTARPRYDRAGRFAVATAVFGSWLWHYGLMGAGFDADTSIAADMALRPIAATSLYVWGQNRQGMALAMIAHGLHQLGLPVHATIQPLFYLVAAAGLFLAMGLLESWPLRLALAVFLAWPSAGLAASLCNRYLLPAAFLLALGQVIAFRAAVREPTPWRIARAAMLAGLLLWIAENCVVLFPAELWIVGLALYRGRGKGALKGGAAALAGAALPAAIIALGKHAVRVPNVWGLVRPAQALAVATGLAPQLRELVPALGGVGMYVVLVVIFAWAATELLALGRRHWPDPSAIALLGTAPLLGLVGVSSSAFFEQNLRLARYLSWPAVIAVVGACLALDRLSVRVGRPALAWAAALVFGFGCWLGRFPGQGPEVESHWRHLVALARDAGCRSVIGNHWDVYPFMELTDGEILASALGPAPKLVDGSLALDAVRQPEVCRLRSQRPDPGPCEPKETYSGAGLRLVGETSQGVDGENIQLCRYEPTPFTGFCARAADLPSVATGPGGVSVLASADGAGGRVVELRNGIRFGPFTALLPGDYLFLSRLSAVSRGATATLDVYSRGANRFLARRGVKAEELPQPGSWRVFRLPFTVPAEGVGELELRTSDRGEAGAIREDWIGLFKVDGGPPEGTDLRDPPCASER